MINNIEYIRKNWSTESIINLSIYTSLDIISIVEIAYENNLQNIKTENIMRNWTKEEDEFLINHSNELKIREASNLLHRSHHGVYQRVRLLGLKNMIGSKGD